MGMNIAIVGAGIAGMSAAYDLVRAGHRVTLYEAAAQAGGLASGFRDPSWEWPLERFYHHIFEGDKAIRSLTDAIGYSRNLFFRKGVTAHYWNGAFYPVDSPVAVLRFPGVPLIDRMRFGLASFYLKYGTNNWRSLEGTTATSWAQRWMGTAAYQVIMQPLLEGKMGPYVNEVNMAWLWARLKARSFKLGYFAGGFQGFSDALLKALQQQGVEVFLNTPARSLTHDGAHWTLHSTGHTRSFDRVIVTGSPGLLTQLAPSLPPDYLGQIAQLTSLGAVVLTLALKRPLTRNFYWMQGMRKDQFAFLALVEHTNFIEPSHYGGDHLVYCGDYIPPDHEYFRMTSDELLVRFLPSIRKFNPDFDFGWVRKTWLHREPYAQPIVGLHHSRRIPPLTTPLHGLYWASMSHVYPWDRGTNYAVELGQQVAAELLQA